MRQMFQTVMTTVTQPKEPLPRLIELMKMGLGEACSQSAETYRDPAPVHVGAFTFQFKGFGSTKGQPLTYRFLHTAVPGPC